MRLGALCMLMMMMTPAFGQNRYRQSASEEQGGDELPLMFVVSASGKFAIIGSTLIAPGGTQSGAFTVYEIVGGIMRLNAQVPADTADYPFLTLSITDDGLNVLIVAGSPQLMHCHLYARTSQGAPFLFIQDIATTDGTVTSAYMSPSGNSLIVVGGEAPYPETEVHSRPVTGDPTALFTRVALLPIPNAPVGTSTKRAQWLSGNGTRAVYPLNSTSAAVIQITVDGKVIEIDTISDDQCSSGMTYFIMNFAGNAVLASCLSFTGPDAILLFVQDPATGFFVRSGDVSEGPSPVCVMQWAQEGTAVAVSYCTVNDPVRVYAVPRNSSAVSLVQELYPPFLAFPAGSFGGVGQLSASSNSDFFVLWTVGLDPAVPEGGYITLWDTYLADSRAGGDGGSTVARPLTDGEVAGLSVGVLLFSALLALSSSLYRRGWTVVVGRGARAMELVADHDYGTGQTLLAGLGPGGLRANARLKVGGVLSWKSQAGTDWANI